MVVEERARHELHTKLEEVLGREEATTLMSYLPPVGWADVATKRDLDSLESRLDASIATSETRLEGQIAAFRGDMYGEMNRQTRLLVFSILASNATLAGLAFAAASLA